MSSPEQRESRSADRGALTWRGRAAVGACLGGLAALGAALLAVRRDGWLAPRLAGVAWNALRRHLCGPDPFVAVAGVAGVALLLAAAARAVPADRRRLFDRVALVALAAATFIAATGHGVAPTPSTPAFASAAGIAGNVAFALAALVLAATLEAIARAAPVGRGSVIAGVGAALALAGGPLLLGLSSSTRIAPLQGARTSVVLLSIDTLRADRLGCYGCARDTTRNLDAFARDAIRFEQAATPYPFTLTAHATLLTGVDPAAHGAIPTGPRVEDRLPPFSDVPTLAQAFRDAGWLAIAVVDDCLWMQPAYGLGRGFDLWRVTGGDLASKTRALDEILRDLDGRPCFLFFHCFDVHSDYRRLPYDCAPEDRGVYSGWYHGPFDGVDPSNPRLRASELLRQWNLSKATVPDDVVRYVADLYDEGVRSADRTLGSAIALLDRAGFRDHAALLVTADHGEEFREHGRFMHDAQLFEESVHVPMLLRLPGAAKAGSVVATPVSLVDVAPTLAEIAGVEFASAQGRSLLTLVGAEAPDAAPLFLGAAPGEGAVRLGRFKLLRRGEKVELYDLQEDPAERVDVAPQRPEVVHSLTVLLDQRAERDREAAAARVRGGTISLSDAERKRIGALGYQ